MAVTRTCTVDFGLVNILEQTRIRRNRTVCGCHIWRPPKNVELARRGGEESRVEIEQQRRILSAEQLTFPASIKCSTVQIQS